MLINLKDKLREDLLGGSVHHSGITQVDPANSTDQLQKSGYLSKRPDNVLRLPRKQWPKRYCTVGMNGFSMAHSHVSVLLIACDMMSSVIVSPSPPDSCSSCQDSSDAFSV